MAALLITLAPVNLNHVCKLLPLVKKYIGKISKLSTLSQGVKNRR